MPSPSSKVTVMTTNELQDRKRILHERIAELLRIKAINGRWTREEHREYAETGMALFRLLRQLIAC
jgi:hypothetical protein